jgi:hypothetical protein
MQDRRENKPRQILPLEGLLAGDVCDERDQRGGVHDPEGEFVKGPLRRPRGVVVEAILVAT